MTVPRRLAEVPETLFAVLLDTAGGKILVVRKETVDSAQLDPPEFCENALKKYCVFCKRSETENFAMPDWEPRLLDSSHPAGTVPPSERP